MTDEESLAMAQNIISPYGLVAEFLGEVRTVGVAGDGRTYGKVIVLMGTHPGNPVLEELSTRITNQTGITRVTFEGAWNSSRIN